MQFQFQIVQFEVGGGFTYNWLFQQQQVAQRENLKLRWTSVIWSDMYLLGLPGGSNFESTHYKGETNFRHNSNIKIPFWSQTNVKIHWTSALDHIKNNGNDVLNLLFSLMTKLTAGRTTKGHFIRTDTLRYQSIFIPVTLKQLHSKPLVFNLRYSGNCLTLSGKILRPTLPFRGQMSV